MFGTKARIEFRMDNFYLRNWQRRALTYKRRNDIIGLLAGGRLVVRVAQLVRALDCGSRGRGFESRLSPFFSSTIVVKHPVLSKLPPVMML